MLKSKWYPINLQLFADGGDGGAGDGGAGTGVEAADPGRQALQDLGVPQNRISKKAAQRVTEQLARSNPDGSAAAGAAAAQPKGEGSGRMTWDEIMADPEYQQNMQQTVQKRLKSAKADQANLKALAPALDILAAQYGMDPAKMDYAALAEAVTGDSRYYEDRAIENGRSVEDEMQMTKLEREARQNREQREYDLQEQAFRDHCAKLEQQAVELQQEFPGFDLEKELADDRFAHAVAPSGGLTVKQAYYAIHGDEIRTKDAQIVAQTTARKASNAIQSGLNRPREAGQGSTAPSSAKVDFSKLSRSDFLALKAELERRTAQGEKCYL